MAKQAGGGGRSREALSEGRNGSWGRKAVLSAQGLVRHVLRGPLCSWCPHAHAGLGKGRHGPNCPHLSGNLPQLRTWHTLPSPPLKRRLRSSPATAVAVKGGEKKTTTVFRCQFGKPDLVARRAVIKGLRVANWPEEGAGNKAREQQPGLFFVPLMGAAPSAETRSENFHSVKKKHYHPQASAYHIVVKGHGPGGLREIGRQAQ